MPQNEKFDVLIVGSGLGGLLCGFILSEEGYKVCIVEKNKQIGGNLQTFVRDRCIFDTGVHYIGSLDEGQVLYQYFKYFRIIDKLKLKKLDMDGFDVIGFTGDPIVYKYHQGYENFIEGMVQYFPEERAAIETYCTRIKDICKLFPLYNLDEGKLDITDMDFLQVNAKEYISSLTSNKKLQNVLAGTNSLYAGEATKSPFYVHALIVNSYIESSYRCVDGGSQIARILTHSILQNKGVIYKKAEVTNLAMDSEVVHHALLADGRKIEANTFISNVHPSTTLDLIQTDKLKRAYRNRIKNLENTVSVFVIYIVLKKETFPYLNYNYYHCEGESAWDAYEYTDDTWPNGYALFSSASSKSEKYATNLSLMSYMHYEDTSQWENTTSTVLDHEDRGAEYELFKKKKAEKLISCACRQFPELKENIQSYYTSTPLTYRDYIGTKDGSLYGVLKDCNDPLISFISPRTKVSNLFLTGQNLNMHGVYGVTVAAVKTCSELLGMEYLLNKIKKT